ncbi:MAG: hypothetical protein ACJAT5_000509 [Lentimonas sp.]|jgi:hypothetical protein
MKWINRVLLVATLVGVQAHGSETDNGIRDFWFSGAEINHYQLDQSRYGHQHPGHAELIFVTEPFLTQQQVKNETGGQPSANVLKLNALRTFNTGIYSYRTMTSTFRPIDLASFPHALKTTTSVQDWCGQSFQQINRKKSGWKVELRSYFEKEGDQNYKLNESWLEDELWLLVRLDPHKLPTGSIQVIPGAVTTRFDHHPIRPYQASGTWVQGAKQTTYMLHYSELQKSLEITFDSKFPHIIRAWKETSAQGTTKAVLTHRIMNSKYWSENQPGDRKLRKQLGLEPITD